MNWIAQLLSIFSTNISLPGWVVLAGAVLGAIFVLLLLARSEPNENPLTLLVLVGIFVGGLAVGSAIYGELERADITREMHELGMRAVTLDAALAQSGLGCINADKALEASCEMAVFENPENVASARSLTQARISLVQDALGFVQRRKAFFPGGQVDVWRSPLERDPFGLVASVMLERNNCKPSACGALAAFRDRRRITDNMKTDRYGRLVAKYKPLWAPSARAHGVAIQPRPADPAAAASANQNTPQASETSAGQSPTQNAAAAPEQPQVPVQPPPSAEAPLPPLRPGASAAAPAR